MVHEMAHYFERNHGERFTSLVDKHPPIGAADAICSTVRPW